MENDKNQKNLVECTNEKNLTKFQLLSKKFDKFVTNPKTMASMLIILIVAIALVFCGTASKINNASQLNSDIAKLASENESLTNQNQIMQSQNGFDYQTTEVDKQIFSNGIDAITTAFDNLYKYSSYEIEVTGTTASDAPVLGIIPIDMRANYYKFADGAQFDRVFQDDVGDKVGQDNATEILYKNNKKYVRNGSLTKTNGKLDGNFTEKFKQVSSQNNSHQFYIVTKSTIKKCSLSIKRANGKILYYQVVASLDPNLAVKGYDVDIMEQGGTTLPQFNYVEMTCKIDKNGNLIGYDVKEQMNLSKSVPVIGYVSTQTTNTISTKIISFNQSPSIAEPNL